MQKQKGKCPFCSEQVQAELVEQNSVRRDKCRCPACEEFIYVCRTPGCHDFAKGTETYDHELCPECTDTVATGAKEVASVAAKAGVIVLTAVATAAAKAHFDK